MTTGTTARAGDVRGVFAYFAPLTLLLYLVLPQGYLVDIATSFMLKDHLHATAMQVSLFRLATAIPVYVSVVFGLARDQWNPLGMRDRGFFLIFAPVTALVFAWMAMSKLSYVELFAGLVLVMLTFRFVSAAYAGLLALTGQEQLMSGRLAALWQIVASIPAVAGAFASGWVAEYLPPSRTFLVMAGLALLIGAMGFWKPAAVFGDAYERPQAQRSDLFTDIKRLLKHRAFYPPVLIMFMFQFAPGMNTPLQYYLTNVLHASDAAYGEFTGLFGAAFIPMFFVYGLLCRKVALRKLLFWGTVITVPQMLPLAFIHSADTALLLAVPIGMMGAIAAASYFDLAMRSCPPGLQGTMMMMIDGVFLLSMRGGDVLGSAIYASSPTHGFLYCALTTTAVYALILPVLLLIPKEVIATPDGEANAALEAETLAEIGATTPGSVSA